MRANGRSVPPIRIAPSALRYVTAIALALLAETATGLLSDTTTTSFLMAAILLFGLPHGALDLAILRHRGLTRPSWVAAAVLVYLAAAGLTALLWFAVPGAALASFFAVAALHFAEDWQDDLPPFMALAIAIALLTAPALLHGGALTLILASLTDPHTAAVMTDAAKLIAPVALATAAAAVACLATTGRAERAFTTGASLAAMLLLPPLAGFALFFCAQHSPANYARVRTELGNDRTSNAARETIALTLAALGIAAIVALLPKIDGNVVATGFVTLSVLTMPHLLAGVIAARLARR